MPPKSNTEKTKVYVVSSSTGIEAVVASYPAASKFVVDNGRPDLFIETFKLKGGTMNITPVGKKSAAKSKSAKASQATKSEDTDEDEGEEESKPLPPARKTKTPAEQRAANAAKGSREIFDDVPGFVIDLINNGGDVFKGVNVVVTGVPPTIGRQYTETLVKAFGGHITKSLSKKTGYVVVGNDAGPAKLEKIEELGLKTLDEDELTELLEKHVKAGGKRQAPGAEEDQPNPKSRAKRQKK